MVVEFLLAGLLLILLCLFVAGIAGWIYFGYQRAQGVALPAFIPRRPVPWGLAEFLVLFGLWLLGPVVVARQLVNLDVLPALPKGDVAEAPGTMAAWMGVSAGSQLVILLLFTVALVAIGYIRIDDLGVGLRHLKRFAVVGLFGAVLILPVIYVVQAVAVQFVEYEHPLLDILNEGAGFGLFLTAAGVAVVVAPICEELLFRVFLQGWLENISGRNVSSTVAVPPSESRQADDALPSQADAAEDPANPYRPADEAAVSKASSHLRPGYWPILVSSFVFAGLHFGQGPAPISLFFMGLGLGYLYRQTHSLWPPLIVHVLLNGITICGTFLSAALPEDSPLAPPPADSTASAAIISPAAQQSTPPVSDRL